MTNADEPIIGDGHLEIPIFNQHCYGLTKREYFAAMAMQGIIAAHSIHVNGIDNEVNAEVSVNAADALIKALNLNPKT